MDASRLLIIVGFSAAIVAGLVVQRRGMLALTAEQQAQLLNAFSRQRQLSKLLVLAIAVLVVAFPYDGIRIWLLLSWILFNVLCLLLALPRMRAIQLPRSYIRTYAFSEALPVAGLIVCLASLQAWT